MKKLLVFLIFLLMLSPLYSREVKFEWDFKLNQTLTIDKYTKQTVIENGKIKRKKMVKDYVVLLPVGKKDDFYHLKGKYFSYSKSLLARTMYQFEDAYNLDFYMSKRGEYKVPENYIQPSIRNIPLFPEKAISPGHMWTEKGLEILEFNPPITISVDVNYQFVGFEEKFGKKLAKIVYNYLWNHIVDHKQTDAPYKFVGNSFYTLWYDTEKHLPVYVENLYDLGMIYYNGTFFQYKGDLKGYYNLKRTAEERENVKNEMYEKLKKSDKQIDIRKGRDNLIIDLGEIYFKFDSSELTDAAKEKLKRIGEVLENYKDCRILTKGHTDNTGRQKYNQGLSEKRARSVLGFLKENNFIDPNQSSYKGIGEIEPRYDNRTKEGRSKNRRVEIIITPE